ncbi:MAG: hypothetical protein ABMA25_06220, partial [Ilumatobacteraceae bacterium]
PTAGATDGERCDDTLLQIDGQPVGLLLPANSELGADVGTSVQTCEPLTLSAGSHTATTANGLLTGVDINRLVLDDGVAAATAAAPTAPQVTVERTRTTRTATVAPCPDGCWLIMGEGFNTGWAASVGGRSLGAPQQIAGGFNGWWLPASTAPTVVDIEWQAQTPVTLGLVVSAVAVLACIALAIGRRRRRGTEIVWAAEPPQFARSMWQPTTWRPAIVSAAALIALTALLVSPEMALFALVPAVLIVALRRPVIAGPVAIVLISGIGARIVQRQRGERHPANAAWPGFWEKLHGPALVVVMLLVAASLLDGYRPRHTPPAAAPPADDR